MSFWTPSEALPVSCQWYRIVHKHSQVTDGDVHCCVAVCTRYRWCVTYGIEFALNVVLLLTDTPDSSGISIPRVYGLGRIVNGALRYSSAPSPSRTNTANQHQLERPIRHQIDIEHTHS